MSCCLRDVQPEPKEERLREVTVNVQVNGAGQVPVRRLAGIDLGIASEHTVRVLDGAGNKVCAARCVPTRESLLAMEARALAGAPAGTRLEVVLEPAGAAWFPVARFLSARGHAVYRVSSAKAADLRKFYRRHAKSNGIDAETLARVPLADPGGLIKLEVAEGDAAVLDRRVRACDRLTQQAARHKTRIKDLVRQLMPMTPLTGDVGKADLQVLERYADPRALLAAGPAQLAALIRSASRGHQGQARAAQWAAAAQAAIELYGPDDPAVPFADLAAEVATEIRSAPGDRRRAHRPRRRPRGRLPHGRSRPDRPDAAGPGRGRRPGHDRHHGQARPVPRRPPLQVFPGPGPPGQRDRRDAQGRADDPGRAVPGPGHHDPGRRHRPQARPPARPHLLHPDDRTRRRHLKACCVVAGHLALRLHAAMLRGAPYQLRDTDGTPVTPEQARQIIAANWTVPDDVRKRRRSRKTKGRTPQQASKPVQRGDPPRPGSRPGHTPVNPAP